MMCGTGSKGSVRCACGVSGPSGYEAGVQGRSTRHASCFLQGVELAEITFNSVWKRYPDGFEAVKDMNLEINDGEFMILVGPSGCGKSTALRMIAGLEDITEGDL